MDESVKDEAMLKVLAERFETQRLPRILAIRERVEQGEKLSDFDIEFLKTAFADAASVKPLLDRHPQYQSTVSRVVAIYKEITSKALENEDQQ